MPICASPLSFITVCTSAKSRLIRAGKLIRSVMPCTPCWSTSSAFFNASGMVVLRSTISRSLSFGMTISVSTPCLSRSMPDMALTMRAFASKVNGFVTTPTVKMPFSLAIFATTGAAPVPVPPPIPQVTNIISAPSTAAESSSALSSAAFMPTSGSAPAPSPLVSFSPIWISVGALQSIRACLSVLTPTNSTPPIFSSIILFTALLPAPPTPITMIFALESDSVVVISSKGNTSLNLCVILCQSDWAQNITLYSIILFFPAEINQFFQKFSYSFLRRPPRLIRCKNSIRCQGSPVFQMQHALLSLELGHDGI